MSIVSWESISSIARGDRPCEPVPPQFTELEAGAYDHVFARYGINRRKYSTKPYRLVYDAYDSDTERTGGVFLGAEQDTVITGGTFKKMETVYTGRVTLQVRPGTRLAEARPLWWCSTYYHVPLSHLVLFDTMIDLDRVSVQFNEFNICKLHIDGERTFQPPGVERMVLALHRAGIRRCRLFGFLDPFENVEDRMAYLGEVL